MRRIPARLPKLAQDLTRGYAWTKVTIGASPATTCRLERSGHQTMYLKIDPKSVGRDLLAETDVLTWLRGRLCVPDVLSFAAGETADYLLTSAIPGWNAADVCGTISNIELVRLLAAGLRMVHSVPIAGCPFDRSLARTLRLAEFNVRHGLVDEKDFDYVRHGRTATELYGELLRLRPEHEDLVFTHGDYCLPNIIFDGQRVSGFVDLSRAGIADRYQDIALAIRSIASSMGSGFEQVFCEEYGIGRPDRQKIDYFMLLDEFF